MPTARPRHTLTETDALSQALDAAALQWPADRDARAKLLVRLVEEGHRAIRARREDETERRREAIRRASGALSGVYPEGYLARLREDWPD